MARKKQIRKKNLCEIYKKSWSYIKESKRFIWIVVGIFFFFTVIGFFVPAPDYISKLVSDYAKEIVKETSGLSLPQLISFIFFNNAKSSFFGLVFGIIFGIFPTFIAAFNGYILGFISNESVKQGGVLVLWKLLPHGIFELPAVFISLGLGMKLGIGIFREKGKFKENFIESFRVFLLIVIPLLIIAAIIEGTLIFFVR